MDRAVDTHVRVHVASLVGKNNEKNGIKDGREDELNSDERKIQNGDDRLGHERGGEGSRGQIKGEDTDGDKFRPGYQFYLAFSSLAVLALMVSLDGTSVSVALPVRPLLSFPVPPPQHLLLTLGL